MQLLPDWTQQVPETEIEAFLEGFDQKFLGPGLYKKCGDTMLIVPRWPNEETPRTEVWSPKQPEGVVYDVHVYNCPFEQTVLSAMVIVPTHKDDREAKRP